MTNSDFKTHGTVTGRLPGTAMHESAEPRSSQSKPMGYNFILDNLSEEYLQGLSGLAMLKIKRSDAIWRSFAPDGYRRSSQFRVTPTKLWMHESSDMCLRLLLDLAVSCKALRLHPVPGFVRLSWKDRDEECSISVPDHEGVRGTRAAILACAIEAAHQSDRAELLRANQEQEPA